MKKIVLMCLLFIAITTQAQIAEVGLAPRATNGSASVTTQPRISNSLRLMNPDSKVFGFNSFAGSIPPGPFSFYLDDIKAYDPLPTAVPSGNAIYAGAWLNDKWYGFSYLQRNLVTIDTVTGAWTVVGFTGLASSSYWEGITMDVKAGVAYAVSTTGTASSLYTIDLSTGATTLIGTSSGTALINLACDINGNLYAVDIVGDNFGSIDKSTGDWTVIGPIGFNASYAQDMSFDYSDGTLYWAAYNVTSTHCELRTVDVSTGSSAILATFPDSTEVTGFAIPYDATIGIAPIKNSFTSFNAYPNPAHSNTMISFSTTSLENISLDVFDICGQKVLRKELPFAVAGTNKVEFNTEILSAGIYFCRLNSSSTTETLKLIIQ